MIEYFIAIEDEYCLGRRELFSKPTYCSYDTEDWSWTAKKHIHGGTATREAKWSDADICILSAVRVKRRCSIVEAVPVSIFALIHIVKVDVSVNTFVDTFMACSSVVVQFCFRRLWWKPLSTFE